MFKDNKLRLLMTLVGWTRLGEAHDPDASWIIPSSLTWTDLQEAIDLIRKYEFAPPTYEDGKGPEDLLRSKASAARRSTRRVDFDDDDDNEGIANAEEEDHGEYAHDAPTGRKPDGERKKLKRRQRARTPVELDDEEKDRRAAARRKKELERLAKEKSTMFVHDSDDEDDAERDAEFFAREEALRKEMTNAFGKSLVLATIEPAVPKKRKAEESAPNGKRRKTPPKRKAPFADSDDESDEDMDDVASVSSRALSTTEARDVQVDSEDEAIDTPTSSQHENGVHESNERTPINPTASTAMKNQDVTMADSDDDDDENDDVPVVRRPMARNTRAGFIIDSDSE
jgi:replication fork protection complex subunit Tof1/Swi1